MSESSQTAAAADANLMRDVRRLIYENCGNSSIWDHLGNLDRLTETSPKHVRIANEPTSIAEDMELLEVPTGLGLLFYAAQAVKDTKVTPNLTRLMLLAAAPPPAADPCHRLYIMDKEQRAKRQASLDALQAKLMQEEMAECTFRPVVSEVAAHLPPKGPNFFDKCVEWKKHAREKSIKKATQEREEKRKEEYTPWEMSKRSKQLIERQRQRRGGSEETAEEAGGAAAASSPPNAKASSGAGGGSPARAGASPGSERRLERTPQGTSFVRLPRKAETYSFEPITNTATRRELYLTGNPGGSGGGSADAREGDGCSGGAAAAAAGADGDAQHHRAERATTTASQIVQRLQDDAKAREQRAQERQKKKEEFLKEHLFDPETGQELFQPNAKPTKRMGKKRVPFDDLPPEEQKEFRAKLARLGMSFITSKRLAQRTNEPKRDMADFFATVVEQQKRAETNVERIKRNEEKQQDDWFKPKLTERSLQMASSRAPPHEQELPKKPPPPEPVKKPVSSAKAMNAVVQRSQQWIVTKLKRQESKVNKLKSEEVEECTFQPKRDAARESVTAHKHVAPLKFDEAAMLASAEVRMRNELEILRGHPSYRDPTLGTVGARSVSSGGANALQLRSGGVEGGGVRGASLFSSATAETVHRIANRSLTSLVVESSEEVCFRHDDGDAALQAPGEVKFKSPPPFGGEETLLLSPAPTAPPRIAPRIDLTQLRRPPVTNSNGGGVQETQSPVSDPLAVLNDGVDELEHLLAGWKDLERETDDIFGTVS